VEVALTFMLLFYHGRTLRGDVNTTAGGEP